MKRLMLALILSLFTLTGAYAQQKDFVQFRARDIFLGHVRSVRVETATISKASDGFVEGPRKLWLKASYSPDGKKKEEEIYANDGSLLKRFVHVYDDKGRQVEMSSYDGRNNLLSKFVYHVETDESFIYNGDGSLDTHVQIVRSGNENEDIVFDGNGALLRRIVNTREDGKDVIKTYGPDGSLTEKSIGYRTADGAHRTEVYKYNPDGTVANQSVMTSDVGTANLYFDKSKDGTPRSKAHQKREFDSHKNLLKATNYVWNDAAHDLIPYYISYYMIDYYD